MSQASAKFLDTEPHPGSTQPGKPPQFVFSLQGASDEQPQQHPENASDGGSLNSDNLSRLNPSAAITEQLIDDGDPGAKRLSKRNGFKVDDETPLPKVWERFPSSSIRSSEIAGNKDVPPKIDEDILFEVEAAGRAGVRLIDVFAIYVSRGKDGKADTSIFEQKETEAMRRKADADIWKQTQPAILASGMLRRTRTGRLTKEPAVQLKGEGTNLVVPSGAAPESFPRDDGYASPTEKSKGFFNWLADDEVLPSFLPVARIVGFNIDLKSNMHAPLDFDAMANDIAGRISAMRAKDQRRAAVLIGHGYGNIVLKRLLSDQVQESASFKGSTAMVLFFGAPFLGLDPLLDWTAQSLNLTKKESMFSSKSTKDLASSSQSWSKFLEDLRAQDISSYAFLEKNFGATLESGSEKDPAYGAQELKLDVDRFMDTTASIGDVAKFSGRQDPNFRLMCTHVAAGVEAHQFLGAVGRGDADEVRVWMNRSVNCNISSMTGNTALHIATRKKYLHVLKPLLEDDKINLDSRDNNGRTALHLAVLRGESTTKILGATTLDYKDIDYKIVDELLAAGANPDVRDHDQLTPRDIAYKQGAPTWMQDLLRRPQLVRGPSRPERLKRERNLTGATLNACERMTISFKEVYAANSPARDFPGPEKPDTYRQISPSVKELIYDSSSARELFKSFHSEFASEVAICQWFHIPMNNMVWVHDLFAKLEYNTWPWPARHRSSNRPHSRCMYPQAAKISSTAGPEALVILMPYISYEKKSTQVRTERLIDSVREWERSFGGETTGDLDDGMVSSIKAYLYHKHSESRHSLPLHPRRTLDQSYYHMLNDTVHRDNNQVVARYALNHSKSLPQPVEDNYNILMVDQLWLWCIKGNNGEPNTIISSFPTREGAKPTPEDGLERNVLKSKRRSPIFNTVDLMSRILTMCSMTLERHQDCDKSLQFLLMFESTIGHAEEKLTRLFRDFRETARTLYDLNEKHQDYQQERKRFLKKLLDIRKESNLLEEIQDILDEIKMVQAVIEDQIKVLKSPEIAQFLCDDAYTESDWERGGFKEPLKILRGIKANFEAMQSLTKAVEDGLNHLLDLKQKQANLWEARSSREGAEEAAKQGKTLLVFTIVTIIFLPLSFMASFFAIDIRSFPKDPVTQNTSWPLHYVGGLLFGISFGVSVPFILLAYKISWLTTPWYSIRHIWLKRIVLKLVSLLRHTRSPFLQRVSARMQASVEASLYLYAMRNESEHYGMRFLEAQNWSKEDLLEALQGSNWSQENAAGLWTAEFWSSIFPNERPDERGLRSHLRNTRGNHYNDM